MRLSFAIGTLALAFTACGGTADAPSAAPAEEGSAGRQTRRGEGSAPQPVDLDTMLAPVPEYEGTGRNLFVFGSARRAGAADLAPPPVEQPPTPPPPRVAPRPPVPAAPRVDVKYAGFLEKTGPDGVKAKYAIFLDGNEILAGGVGETVANQFTVVEIGLESVTVSAQGSRATQRIPLQSN
jgi:hypothetical protein